MALIILYLFRDFTVPMVTKMIKEKRAVTQIDGDNRLLLLCFWQRLQEELPRTAAPAAPAAAPAADEETEPEEQEDNCDWSAEAPPAQDEEEEEEKEEDPSKDDEEEADQQQTAAPG